MSRFFMEYQFYLKEIITEILVHTWKQQHFFPKMNKVSLTKKITNRFFFFFDNKTF